MADPFRLRVLKALCATIKTVTPARTFTDPATGEPASFIHDLSDYQESGAARERVFRGREWFGANDPLPMVSVLEHPNALDALLAPASQPQVVGDIDILIQGFVEDDPEHPTDPAHRLAAEVISVIAEAAKRPHDILGFGHRMPCVSKLAIGSPVVRPADGVNSSQACFWLTLTLTLVEDRERPFA